MVKNEMKKLLLGDLLEHNGIDSTVYAEYFMSLYVDGSEDDIKTWVKELLPDSLNSESLIEKIVLCCKNGSIEIESEEAIKNNLAEEQNGLFPVPQDLDVTSIAQNEICDYPLHIHEEEPNYEELEDLEEHYYDDDYDEWLEVAFQLDSSIQTIFPGFNFSSSAISVALTKSSGNVDSALELLMLSHELFTACRPCRHMLTGKCFRSDCMFDHNVGNVPCRYWMHVDGCLNQNGICPFLHDLPDVPRSFAISSNEFKGNFPSLHTNRNQSTSSIVNPTINGSYAAKLKAQRRSGSSENRSVSSPVSHKNLGKSPSTSQSGSMKSSSAIFSSWVDSGVSVRVEYETARSEARELAITRNKFLQEATVAFKGGAKAVAKNLSAQGQSLNRLMKEKHREAAQTIFQKRNSPASVNAGFLDLHGLHVAEALECLDELLPELLQSPFHRRKPVRVITGSGHHTVGGKKGTSRLLASAKQYIESIHEYSYVVVTDVNGFECALDVSVK